MAAFSICYRTPYKKTCIVLGRDSLLKTATKFRVYCSSESSSVEKKLRSLDSYFGKLQHNTKLHDSDTSEKVIKVNQSNGQDETTDELESLDEYLGKLNNGINQESLVASYVENHMDESLVPKKTLSQDTQRTNFRKPSTYVNIRRIKGSSGSISAIDSQQLNDTSSLYLMKMKCSINAAKIHGRDDVRWWGISAMDSGQKLLFIEHLFHQSAITTRDPSSSLIILSSDQYTNIFNDQTVGILASVNIGVFLFEIASPIRNDNLELFTLPQLYGAKINDLIMVGEWWRLITPMFLHAGIFHIALSCWALVSFGPQVCKGYGSFTFFLIYILGGVSGNLASFLHTPDPTVGGTGPVFAIIGAWLMYQIQNRDVIANDDSENLFKKAMIITALGFILCNLGPIDEWSHSGAAITGMAYSFLISPTLQLDDTSPVTGEEGLKLVRKYGASCKSLIIFTIFVVVLSSLLLFTDPLSMH